MGLREILLLGAVGVSIYLYIIFKTSRRNNNHIKTKSRHSQSQTERVDKTSSDTDDSCNNDSKTTADRSVQTITNVDSSCRLVTKRAEDKCSQTEPPTELTDAFPNEFSSKRTKEKCSQTESPKYSESTLQKELSKDDVIEGYPPPKPPDGTKSEIFSTRKFSELKQNALKVIPITELQSYESLLNHLCGSLKSDLDRVYAIFCWIVNQRLPVINDVKHIPNTESPESFLYRIVQRKGTFAELMCKMCRHINIPCVVIHGFEKDLRYDGEAMQREYHKNTWNVVYLEKNWRFVHCLWASKLIRVYPYEKLVGEQKESWSNNLIPAMHDFYFLTDPSIFIYKFRPLDDRWQLLNETVSQAKFESLSYLQPAFHILKLELVERDIDCIVHISETFTLKIRIPPHWLGKLFFDYRIYRLQICEDDFEQPDLKRYSLHYIIDDIAFFEIRFPPMAVGEYNLQIYCNVHSDNMPPDLVCKFKILCKKGLDSIAHIPIDSRVGFGSFSAYPSKHGVEALSHTNGLYPWVDNDMEFNFTCPKSSDAKALLKKIGGDDDKDFGKYVKTEKKDNNVKVIVYPPAQEQGEFVLKILISDPEASEFVNVYNYLLERTESQIQRKARENLLKLLRKDNVKSAEIQKATEEFLNNKGKDLGEVEKAERKIHHLSLKGALEELRRYRNPPLSVVTILHATYILLGRNEKDILEWRHQRKLLCNIEVTLNDFEVRHVSCKCLTTVKETLKDMDQTKAENASAAAAKLYEWATSVIRKIEEQNSE
ncbi:hillarin-like isoform X3 [Ostrea edulis]|uniref:hillarin-like isoform X3 n=1 Tax=Ostrea edulis TaxID=37623 RepID=UPI0024AEB0C0|nr:hillarin-like isoform X3 [Ostrea edulis]